MLLGKVFAGSFSSFLKRSGAIGILGAVALFLIPSAASAQVLYWDAAGTHPTAPVGGAGTWNSSLSNWSSASTSGTDGTWVSGDIANFGSPAGTVTVSGAQSVGGIQFGLTGYNLTGGPLNFSSGATVSYTNTTAASAAETLGSTLSGSNLIFNTTDTALTGSLTYTLTGTANTLGGSLTVDDTGVTSATGGITLQISNAGALGSVSQVNLNGGVSTGVNSFLYVGNGGSTGLTISGVALDINTKGGILISNLAAGSGATNTWTGNEVQTASGSIRNTSANTVLDFQGTISNASTVSSNLNFTAGVGQSSSSSPALGADVQLDGVISNGGSGTLSMTYYQSGTLTNGNAVGTAFVTNTANTYTGTTTIRSMVLNVASLANGGTTHPSSLGESSNVASNLLISGNPGTGSAQQLNSGTLQYTGSALQSTDRLFSIGANISSVTNNATIDASGSAGSLSTVSFTNTGSVGFGSSGANLSNFGLYLTGSNTGQNLFAPKLADDTSTYTSNLTKQGVGSWVLTNSNTYSGGTTVSNGTLLVNGGTVAGLTSGVGTGAVSVTGASSSALATLGGSGTIKPTGANAVAVNNYGVLAPGNGLDATSGLTINSGSSASNLLTFSNGGGTSSVAPSLTFNLNSGNVSNLLTVNGGVSYFGGSSTGGNGNIVNFNDLSVGTLSLGLYTLVNETSATGLTLGTVNNLTTDPTTGLYYITGGLLLGSGLASYTGSGDTAALEFNNTTNTIYLDLSVPEPSTWALLLGGLGLLFFWHRRTMKSRSV